MVALAKIPAASFTGHGTPEVDSISLFEKSFEILFVLILCVCFFACTDVCVPCMQCLGG